MTNNLVLIVAMEALADEVKALRARVELLERQAKALALTGGRGNG